MAVCVSGDFEPDEMVATIEKYFGDMQPNPNLPELQFEPEKPITTPVVTGWKRPTSCWAGVCRARTTNRPTSATS